MSAWPRIPRGDYCTRSHHEWSCQVALSNNSMNDLVGAQIQRRFKALALALEKGCNYVHRPLRASFFGPRFDRQMAGEAERFFGLGQGCLSWSSMSEWGKGQSWRQVKLDTQIRGAPVPAQGYGSEIALTDIFLQLRRRMHRSPPIWYGSTPADHLHAAIHVRRGDLATHPHWASGGRWWPDEYYEYLLPRLFAAVAARGNPFTLHVFSDGGGWAGAKQKWMRWWGEHGRRPFELRFHIDEDYLQTMAHMADADVLVLSSSDFSNVMANYNVGLLASTSFGIKHARTPRRVPEGDPLWCGSFCDSGLWFGDQLRVLRLPTPPSCSCMSIAMRARVVKEMRKNTQNGQTWQRITGLSALELEHGHFSQSADHNCTLVCRGKQRLGRDAIDTQRASAVMKVMLPAVGRAIADLLAWKTRASKQLAKTNWTPVAALLHAPIKSNLSRAAAARPNTA